MFCNKCGEKLVETASFCHNCGEQIDISSCTKKKKAPDPSFAAKPIAVQTSKPVEKPLIPPLPVEKTAHPISEPVSEKVQEDKTGEKIDEVVKILRNDMSEEEEEIIFAAIEPEEKQPEPEKKRKKGKGKALVPAAVFVLIAAVMILAALTVIMPDTKPFSSIREALGIVQTATDSSEQTTSALETTAHPETEPQTLQPADGTELDRPVSPDVFQAKKIHINAIVYSETKSLRVEFSVDFSDENETVFYIPADAQAQTADMIYVLSDNGTYSSFEGGYGQFYAAESDKEYDIENSEIPETLDFPVALLAESFRSDYDGKYRAAGSEVLDSTGEAYIYEITGENGETETVWVDADTGVFVKRTNAEETVFLVTEAEIDDNVDIPDFRNNIIQD